MLKVQFGNQFKKDVKLSKKRNYDIDLLYNVVEQIANQQPLPPEYREHYLTNNYKRI